MPAAVRQKLDQLLSTLNRASNYDDAERAGIRAESFVPEGERLKALQPASIDTLYLVTEQSVESRTG
ncbi:hypothetical protein [Pseudomonas sp. W2-17]|uniref:hypothetical protein n=1 Tax=Pseudomonas sp. W2-17 TaxID=3058039 RepID=UPI0034E07D14